MIELLIVLNVLMIVTMGSSWVAFIFWKGAVRDFLDKVEKAFDALYNDGFINTKEK